MGQFYFDESIHRRGGFILGAFVYADFALSSAVLHAIQACGMRPGQDEFKSGAFVERHPVQAVLRDRLRDVLRNNGARIALLIAPLSRRESFGVDALVFLADTIRSNNLHRSHHDVYFDQGLLPSAAKSKAALRMSPCAVSIDLHREQDSRTVAGIQLADLVAHSASTVILTAMTLITKQVSESPIPGIRREGRTIGDELKACLLPLLFSPSTYEEGRRDAPIRQHPAVCTLPTCSTAIRLAVESVFKG